MPRHVTISAEIINAIIAGVTDGRSLAVMTRAHQLARATVADRFARDPLLAARFSEARATGMLHGRAALETGAAAPSLAAQRDPVPPAGRQPSPAVPVAAVTHAAPATGQLPQPPVAVLHLSLDLPAVAAQLGRLIGLMADVAAHAEFRR